MSYLDIIVIKRSFLQNSVTCFVKFVNFNSYIHYENLVLPHNHTLLNRVNRRRAIKSVNFSSLIRIVRNNYDNVEPIELNERNSRDVLSNCLEIELPCESEIELPCESEIIVPRTSYRLS